MKRHVDVGNRDFFKVAPLKRAQTR